MPEVLWSPPPDVRTRTAVGRYLDWLEREQGRRFDSYDELWRWSTDDLEGFWASVWQHFGVRSASPWTSVLSERTMPGARWFEGSTLNYAEHALRHQGAGPAVVARSQTRGPVELTWDELRDQVGRCRAGLRRLGVGPGDRVAAYLPNVPEAVVAMLATVGLGAVWSSCPPEFGVRSVVDRFGQIGPDVLLAVGGYRYGPKEVDRGAEVAAIRAALPGLRAVVEVPYHGPPLPDATGWQELLAEPGGADADPVPFDHPLYVLFSSGTTGLPKPIVHGHGGIVLEHPKYLALHHDLGPDDRFFWFSTTGWMMWNFVVSGLLLGSTIVLFDGDPGWPDLGALWRMAEETGVTSFGTSAPFLLSCRKAGLDLRATADLSAVRTVGSTGAPLPAEGFTWVYDQLGPDVLLSSMSGGTDVCTAFVGASPLVPVVAGEISCRCLGAKVEAFDEDGRPVVGEQGELVLTEPMPSMPLGFWGDPDGSRYRDAYFDAYPGVWRHGDWITITERGTCTITGRSDATLNRGGVRLGTAEFYSVVEGLPEVVDSLVVHLDGADRLVLLVQLVPGAELDDDLRGRIAGALRASLSPRHVPDAVLAVRAVPRTHSGKKLEVPVKRILAGAPAAGLVSPGALADPTSLDEIERVRTLLAK